MPSSATPRNRLELQAAGENLNTWGAPKLNNDISQIDASLDGWTFVTVSGVVTLTSVNYQADQSRQRILSIIGGTGGGVVIPSVEKWYLVKSKATGAVVISTGSGRTVTVDPDDIVLVMCDGANVDQLGYNLVGIKEYIAQVAFASSGALPAQPGNAGKFVKTDGTNASWQYVNTSDIGDWTYQRQLILNESVAFAIAL